jgi:hypothetical protein
MVNKNISDIEIFLSKRRYETGQPPISLREGFWGIA